MALVLSALENEAGVASEADRRGEMASGVLPSEQAADLVETDGGVRRAPEPPGGEMVGEGLGPVGEASVAAAGDGTARRVQVGGRDRLDRPVLQILAQYGDEPVFDWHGPQDVLPTDKGRRGGSYLLTALRISYS